MELLYLPRWGGVLSSHYCLLLLVKLRCRGSAVNKCRSFRLFTVFTKPPVYCQGEAVLLGDCLWSTSLLAAGKHLIRDH